MHCHSCEIFIEKKLLELDGVKSVEASVDKKRVVIEYENQKPDLMKINGIFKESNYIFSEAAVKEKLKFNFNEFAIIASIILIVISVFVLMQRFGLSALVNVNSYSSLPSFFVFGLLAGVSTCAALVGGIILSMSKQWSELYYNNGSFLKKSQPHVLFNAGRIISYGFFGALLGVIGNQLKISPIIASVIVFAVSIMMILFSLDMLGIGWFGKFQITAPKFLTKYIADENHFKGKYMPFLMGAGTFFIPCGFTATVQSLALLSGSASQGGLMMALFSIGTTPALLAIGLSSIGFMKSKIFSERFMKVAGALVLFFAIFNINSQLDAIGVKSFSDIKFPIKDNLSGKLPQIVDGKQIVKMNASASGYEPNRIVVKAGIPIKWEITDTGTSGCTNAIISRDLFDGEIFLKPGEISRKEFTIEKPGKYKFSCWMGMVSGIIEVIE